MNECLRPNQRLREKSFFQIIFKKGKFLKGHLLNLWVCEASEFAQGLESDPPRLGLIVSRKTDLKATRRNLWKRRIREAFRRQQNQMRRGIVILVQSKKQKVMPSYQAIFMEIRNLLTALGALKS